MLHDHRKATKLLASLRPTGMIAPMVFNAPINSDWFEAQVPRALVPEPDKRKTI